MRLILLVLIVGGVFWSGYHKTPLGAADGVALDGASTRPTPADGHIRVGAFNIQGGVGADNRYDLDRTADALRGCDLVGLCEVHGRTLTIPSDQAHLLGDKLGLAYLFAPAERRWRHDDFGNGILCDLDIVHWQRFPMATPTSTNNRAILLVRARYGGRILNILVAHVERTDRDRQLREVVEMYQSLAAPALLLGDLNAVAIHPLLRELLADHQNVDTIAQATHDDHIIWIVARGLACLRAGIVDKGASDHPFYWADLELSGGPQ